MSCVWTVGGVTSRTVTVAVAMALLPLLSVTVRVTMLAPSLEQSKLDGLTARLVMAKVSVEALSTCAAVMLAMPVASRFTTMSCVWTVGGVASRTVTVAVALALLPLLSVNVRVRMLAPWVEQSKLDGLPTRLVMAQLSLEALSTCAAVMLAWPLPSKIGRASCGGRVGVSAAAVALKEEELALVPPLSVTVRGPVLAPSFEQ